MPQQSHADSTQQQKTAGETDVKEERAVRRLLFHLCQNQHRPAKTRRQSGATNKFDPSAPNPTEALDEEQHSKHDNEAHIEFVAEDGHGQAGFRHCVPGLFVHLLNLHGTQRAVKQQLQGMAEDNREDNEDVRQDLFFFLPVFHFFVFFLRDRR